MRYIMKGGVWKNSQDQILKAAIMKYGLNQWSRISSLLQRKSAKQCKQRWYEWLDPSIKKTQWTRAEDQKLLQLARVFPSQWRTVAPFVGRTPTQCYQRYEKLLDMAQGKSIKQTEDLKKLRPGEIDPNPQTKPARLDPIDMDEDQKEMLAQVRVRLANTKGKKAKRKQREKIIQQARRLAQLQKIRELQMAGVDNIPTTKQIKRLKQNKSIDYNKQIPFKREIPQFKYAHQGQDDGRETKGASYANTINLQNLEGKRRDVEEELQRKMDKRRMKKLKERDLKIVINMKNNFQKPVAFPVELPQPQITQKDLQEMKKYNITTPFNSQFLSKSNQTPLGMSSHNKLLLSARLNMSLNHQDMQSSQQMNSIQALNYLKTIQKQSRLGLNQPLRSIDRVLSQQRMKTPINSQWEGGQQGKRIKSLFKGLSKPQNQVEFQIPQEDQEDEEQLAVLDAQEADRIQNQRLLKQDQIRRAQQSSALKLNLPRFKIVPQKIQFHHKNQVNAMIQQEMLSLIYSDAIDYPIEDSIFPNTSLAYKDHVSKQFLEAAEKDVQQQMQRIQQNKQQVTVQQLDTLRKRVKLDFKQNSAHIQAKILNEKQNLQQKVQKYKINQSSFISYQKSVQASSRKSRKLLLGFNQLIKTKLSQLNNLSCQLSNLSKSQTILSQLRIHQRQSIQSRFNQLNQQYRMIYKAI